LSYVVTIYQRKHSFKPVLANIQK